MCNTCGCNITPGNREFAFKPVTGNVTPVSVLKNLLQKNDDQAAHNRHHFDMQGVLAINLMSSPGSGKTALLEATIEALKNDLNLAVIEGDLETENDADRIRAKGIPAVQITTGSACHLDAHMLHDALHQISIENLDILFIENVGNLVCPASFDLGQHRNVTLLSVTEGDDKPAKYPVMFRAADLVVLSKTDLLAVLDDFDPGRAENYLRNLASEAEIFQVSARKKMGLDTWFNWLRKELADHRERVSKGQTLRPMIQPEGAELHALSQ